MTIQTKDKGTNLPNILKFEIPLHSGTGPAVGREEFRQKLAKQVGRKQGLDAVLSGFEGLSSAAGRALENEVKEIGEGHSPSEQASHVLRVVQADVAAEAGLQENDVANELRNLRKPPARQPKPNTNAA